MFGVSEEMERAARYLEIKALAEQKEIAACVQQKDAEFRRLFEQIEQQIATLPAYRQSLIHECVTGQRRIPEAVTAPASATVPGD